MSAESVSACRRIAEEIKTMMDREGRSFITIPRMQLTERYREIVHNDSTRIKSEIGRTMDESLRVYGLAAYPPVDGTSTVDALRIYRLGSPEFRLLDLFLRPSADGDDQLQRMLSNTQTAAAAAVGRE